MRIIKLQEFAFHKIFATTQKENLSIKPALTLKAKIAHVKELESNMYISYNIINIISNKTWI